MFKVNNKDTRLALIQAIFYIGDRFGCKKIGAQKMKKQFFSKVSSIL